MRPEELLQEYKQIEQQMQPLVQRQNQIKQELAAYVQNDKRDGTQSQSFEIGNVKAKVTQTNRMNVTLKKKEFEEYKAKGGQLPDGLIETKESVHKSTLKKMIEKQDEALFDIDGFVNVSYSSSVSVKFEDQ